MRKIIRLTENDIRRIVKQVLLEKMGVPDNIAETGRSIYAEIMTKLFSMDPEEQSTKYQVVINKNFNISDFHFNTVDLTISVRQSSLPPEMLPVIRGFAAGLPQKTGNNRIEHLHGIDRIKLFVNVDAKDQWVLHDIIKLLIKDEDKTISSITHELKHAYDNEKRPGVSFRDESEYESNQAVSFGPINPMNLFFHYLYYLHRTEDLTRPSQMFSQMMTKGVTKSQFLKFYNESEMVETLKSARSLTYENFKSSLHSYITGIQMFFDYVDSRHPDDPPIERGNTNDEVINNFLEYVHRVAVKNRIAQYKNVVKQSIQPPDFQTGMMIMMGLIEAPDFKDKQKLVDEYTKIAGKYKNYEDFFGNEIKMINFAANKTLRKLAKLYDMAKDDKKLSIENWDAHYDANNTFQKTIDEMAKAAREIAAEKLRDKKTPKKGKPSI